jgi:uncharacterized membrane protein
MVLKTLKQFIHEDYNTYGSGTLLLKLMIFVIFAIITITSTIGFQQVKADYENGNEKSSCNDQHSDLVKCPQRDSTPFILPFP